MRKLLEHRPKFKVGDKVKSVWDDTVCTVTGIAANGYYVADKIADKFVAFENEIIWELVKKTVDR